jgi:hypothetical protein
MGLDGVAPQLRHAPTIRTDNTVTRCIDKDGLSDYRAAMASSAHPRGADYEPARRLTPVTSRATRGGWTGGVPSSSDTGRWVTR